MHLVGLLLTLNYDARNHEFKILNVTFHVLHKTHYKASTHFSDRFTTDHNRYFVNVQISQTGRQTIDRALFLCIDPPVRHNALITVTNGCNIRVLQNLRGFLREVTVNFVRSETKLECLDKTKLPLSLI